MTKKEMKEHLNELKIRYEELAIELKRQRKQYCFEQKVHADEPDILAPKLQMINAVLVKLRTECEEVLAEITKLEEHLNVPSVPFFHRFKRTNSRSA